jgi:hypothetical protein
MSYKILIGVIILILIGVSVYSYRTPSTFTDNSIYSNTEYSITYPKGWKVNKTNSGVGIINPERSGKPDTDVPVEGISIWNTYVECKPTQWEEGFGLIFYKTVCLDNKIKITMSAFDQASKILEDAAVSSIVLK